MKTKLEKIAKPDELLAFELKKKIGPPENVLFLTKKLSIVKFVSSELIISYST